MCINAFVLHAFFVCYCQYQQLHTKLCIYIHLRRSFTNINPLNTQMRMADVLMYILTPGTSPDGVDVQDFVDVGVTNMVTATGLTLLDGLTYYVTLRGMYS